MSCTFDGPNKLIIMNNGITSITVQNMYSLWKVWSATSDNLKYLPAFAVLGGDPTVAGKYLGTTFFLENGWKIRPFEGNHSLTIEGNLYSRDGNSPTVHTVGNYNVLVSLSTSNLVDTVATGGGATGDFPTANEIANAVNASLQVNFDAIPNNVKSTFVADMQRLLEMYNLLGLDPTKPLLVTQNARIAGSIQQSIVTNVDNHTTTVTRVN